MLLESESVTHLSAWTVCGVQVCSQHRVRMAKMFVLSSQELIGLLEPHARTSLFASAVFGVQRRSPHCAQAAKMFSLNSFGADCAA